MGSCCVAQEAWPGTLWWPGGMGWGGGEEDQKGTVCVYNYGCFVLLYGRNQHNRVQIKKKIN